MLLEFLYEGLGVFGAGVIVLLVMLTRNLWTTARERWTQRKSQRTKKS